MEIIFLNVLYQDFIPDWNSLPSWVLVVAALLWILNTFGVLNGIKDQLIFRQGIAKDRLNHQQLLEKDEKLSNAESKRLRNLKEEYIQTHLLEQLTTSASEAMAQVEEANSWIRQEINKKLDLSIETHEKILLILKTVENIQKTMVYFNTEVDLINRHLDDIGKRTMKNDN